MKGSPEWVGTGGHEVLPFLTRRKQRAMPAERVSHETKQLAGDQGARLLRTPFALSNHRLRRILPKLASAASFLSRAFSLRSCRLEPLFAEW